jgi:hypothetical protein
VSDAVTDKMDASGYFTCRPRCTTIKDIALIESEAFMTDYIILDIEFNGRKFASDKPMEVIEIGAVRLNSSLQQVDEFSAFVRPVYFSPG